MRRVCMCVPVMPHCCRGLKDGVSAEEEVVSPRARKNEAEDGYHCSPSLIHTYTRKSLCCVYKVYIHV